MTPRDFVDNDLASPRPEIPRVRVTPSGGAGKAGADTVPVSRPVSDLDLPAITRHKQQIDQRSAVTVEELEKLRRKEEELQRRKRELEEARQRHEDFRKGKQELLTRLSQSLVAVERHELRAGQMAQLLQGTRERFREMLDTLQGLHEDRWEEAEVQERLNEALATIDDARMEFNKAQARVETVVGAETEGGADARPVLFDDSHEGELADRGFLDWLRIGLAVSLPVVLALLLATAVLFLHLTGMI